MNEPLLRSTGSVVDRLAERRILILGSEVDDEAAADLVGRLLLLSVEDPRSDICLLIDSPGGSVLAGLAIYDTMQLIGNDVATVAVGFAAAVDYGLVDAVLEPGALRGEQVGRTDAT